MATAGVDLLINKIVSVLQNEGSIISGVSDELDEIRRELISMKAFIQYADQKDVLDQTEQAWVADVTDIAHEVEDIIDEWMYHLNKHQDGSNFTRTILSFPKSLWLKHKTGTRLQRVNKMIKSIAERRLRYGVDKIEGTSVRVDHNLIKNYAESSHFMREQDLVGIEDDRQLLVQWLTDEEPQRSVISVVGMGGLGKTTLAAKVYHTKIIKRKFDCCAWITISQHYDVEDILRRMVKEFYSVTKEKIPLNLSFMSYRDLVETLASYLGAKRFLVVLDDVWDTELWRVISVCFPEGGVGSRVMLTTRDENIASSSFGVKSRVHHLKQLGETDAWQLFCLKAFSNNPNCSCPQELEMLAHKIVEKGRGLPLAIVALAGTMSSKTSMSEWRRVHDNLELELRNNPLLETLKSILMLSFNNLPLRLKRCFLYCCAFPEDYGIEDRRLIRLWMAEGFIEEVKGVTPEDIAQSYLMELIHRSMLQVVVNPYFKTNKDCRVHDLLRELGISISRSKNFIHIHGGRGLKEVEARRLSIQHASGQELINLRKGLFQLRSLLVFPVDKLSASLNTLPSGFRFLRVLDLQKIPIIKLSNEIVELFNLRYLNLRDTKVKDLPKSFGRLGNLETLDIVNTEIEVLPRGITKLQNLRHLLMYRYYRSLEDRFQILASPSAVPNISKLKNLQVLDSIGADEDFIRHLKSMTQLVRIGISKVREEHGKDLCNAIENMKLLRHLFIMVTNEEFLPMKELSSTPPYLERLFLVGKLKKVPLWFHSLQSLTCLELYGSRLSEDVLSHIQELPNLTVLELKEAYTGSKLHFRGGFKKLSYLHIYDFPKLNKIVIENGAMQGLKEMLLGRCTELKMLPHGIEFLTDLQVLYLEVVSSELIERIRGEDSNDRLRVRHISKIHHRYKSAWGTSHEILS